MLYDEATHDTHLLYFRCQRSARHGWTIERQSADHRSIIMHRTTPPWRSVSVLKHLFNVTRTGTDEYIELILDAQRRIPVRPYQPSGTRIERDG